MSERLPSWTLVDKRNVKRSNVALPICSARTSNNHAPRPIKSSGSYRFGIKQIGIDNDERWSCDINDFILSNIDTSSRRGWRITRTRNDDLVSEAKCGAITKASEEQISGEIQEQTSNLQAQEIVITVEDHDSGDIVGVIVFILIRTIEIQIVELVVRRNERRKGIAMELLKAVIVGAQRNIEVYNDAVEIFDSADFSESETRDLVSCGNFVTKVVLEVSDKNRAALALYEKAGFTVIGRRRKYYRNGDDCLLLST